MRHQETFERQKLLAKVALQQELRERHWRPPVEGKYQCPFCGSSPIGQIPIKRPGRTHCCSNCNQKFSLEDIPGCTCWYPGKLLKCQDCRHYQKIADGVKQRLSGELKDMTVEEAEALLAQPDFYAKERLSSPAPVAQTHDSSVSFSEATEFESSEYDQLNLFGEQ